MIYDGAEFHWADNILNGEVVMLMKGIGVAIGLTVLALGTSSANAHTLDEAKQTLRGLGYHDVRIERASLPFSFNACRHGVRYHIHMNWYGDLVQVDPLGRCNDFGYRPRNYDGRSYDDGYRPERYRRDDY